MRTLLLLVVPALALAAGPAPSASGLDAAAMDRKADPCVDFYRFACGTWMASNPIPADKARYGRFDQLQERNEKVLLEILRSAAAQRSGRSEVEQKIGDHFAACMAEKRSLDPLKPHLDRIRALSREEDLMEEIARLHNIGVRAVFMFAASPDMKDSTRMIAGIGQSGLAMPDRDYYLKTDPKSLEILGKYQAHVARVFKLLGQSEPEAAATAKQVVAFETVIARASMDRVSLRDPTRRYNPLTRAQLSAASPEVPWDTYFAIAGAPEFDSLNVAQPEFLRKISIDLRSQPMGAWRAYFAYHLLQAYSSLLPAAFDDEFFDFHSRTIGGFQQQRAREKRCASAVDAHLGDLLGQKYIEKAFGGASKQRIDEMVDALEKALARDIRELPWMSEATKQAALGKLKTIANNVGAPKKWKDYSAVKIAPDDFLGNAMRATAVARKRNIDKIGKPTDRNEWMMTPPTVNAFYSPQNNSINFPAGILQLPFFDARRDAAFNFGGIGAVIGHELTHGFDDQGRKFDASGNLRDWWTAQDGKEFEKRSACVVDQYSSYTAVDDVKLNGKLTLGENVADHGGVRVALMAMLDSLAKRDTVEGYTPEQRFFLGYAQIWCQNVRPEQSRVRAMTDPHSPGRYRVNGTLQNMPEFQKAFSCQAGQPMVSANACRVW